MFNYFRHPHSIASAALAINGSGPVVYSVFGA